MSQYQEKSRTPLYGIIILCNPTYRANRQLTNLAYWQIWLDISKHCLIILKGRG